jgi:hypothetical protein
MLIVCYCLQLYEAAHQLVKEVVTKRFTNDRDNESQILERLMLAEAWEHIKNGGNLSWVSSYLTPPPMHEFA